MNSRRRVTYNLMAVAMGAAYSFRFARMTTLALVILVASFSFAQTPTKVLEWQLKPTGSNAEHWGEGTQLFRVLDQVEIGGVGVGNSITIGQPFAADDDWLKNLVFHVRNVAGQRLTAIQVTLILPQMENSSPDVVYCYGCAPAEKAQGISPGETVELKMLGGGFYDWVKSRVAEKGGISNIRRAQIREMLVTLPDNSHWVSGCVKTADPKNSCPLAAP